MELGSYHLKHCRPGLGAINLKEKCDEHLERPKGPRGVGHITTIMYHQISNGEDV